MRTEKHRSHSDECRGFVFAAIESWLISPPAAKSLINFCCALFINVAQLCFIKLTQIYLVFILAHSPLLSISIHVMKIKWQGMDCRQAFQVFYWMFEWFGEGVKIQNGMLAYFILHSICSLLLFKSWYWKSRHYYIYYITFLYVLYSKSQMLNCFYHRKI